MRTGSGSEAGARPAAPRVEATTTVAPTIHTRAPVPRLVILTIGAFALIAGGVTGGATMDAKLTISSQAFAAGATIPVKHTCDGQDISPPLTWTEPPAGTKSLALVSDDPDAPMGTWVHWVVWNLPAGARSLPENVANKDTLPDGTKQGITDFGRVGYGGPCPPSGTHRYYFRLYALDATLPLPSSTRKRDLEQAMQGHILAQTELMGRYRRR